MIKEHFDVIRVLVRNLEVNIPNTNKRIYTSSVLNDMVNKINTSDIFLCACAPETSYVEISNIVAKVKNAKLEDGKLTVDLVRLKVPYGNFIDYVDELPVFPAGIGDLNPNDEVQNYTFICLFIGPANDPAVIK
jgi:hypothetical protein